MLSSLWKNLSAERRAAFSLGGMEAGVAIALLATAKPSHMKFLRFPSTLKILNDHTLFEQTAALQGYEPINARFVYRYLPGSISGRNLSSEVEMIPVEKMVEDRYNAMEAEGPPREKP